MASEIKIHLSTYLKDAGIRETKGQIEKLAQNVEKVNGRVAKGADEAAKSVGRLPGAFGKLQHALGGVAAKAMAVIGAIKVGWDIGKWIDANVIVPLLGIRDPIEELKKKNGELKREAAEAAKAWGEALEKWSAGWEREVNGAERARQKIEDLAQAYLKMQAARERIARAGDDATMLGLERDKFNAMASAASPEEAAALGKYHDVLIAEEEAKQKIAQFDRQSEAAAKERESAERQIEKMEERRFRLLQQKAEVEKKLEYAQSQQSVHDLGWEGSKRAEEQALAKQRAIEAQLSGVDRDIANRRADLAAMVTGGQAEEQERRNIEERARLEVDERRKAYDDYIAYVEAQEASAIEEMGKKRLEEARKAAEAEMRERERMERELAAQRLDDLRGELRERERMESAARSRQSAAESSLSTAWGWYRDQSRMQAVIDEQKAQAAAEVQWQKDFDRLRFKHRDWRDMEFGSLSAADEAVRQVALAKEEKAEADRAVIETAENTRDLAEKIDELLQVKGG